jgi:uncharacterized protein (DUF58 family)
MSRTLLLGILLYALLIAGIGSLNGALLALAIPLAVYLGAGLATQPTALSLRAERTLSASHLAHGSPLEVRVVITNGDVEQERLLLEDLVPEGAELVEGETRLLTALAPGESATLSYTLRAPRGAYAFGGVRASASDPTGLFTQRAVLEAPGQVFVLPEVIQLRQVQIRPRRTRIYSGQVPARQGGPGVEFFGVREYQPGDPLRWVNDRVSARHQETLFVNEFEQERAADICLVLDTRRRSDVRVGGGRLFEHSVVATASLAQSFLASGNRVGMLLHGGGIDWVVPGYGKVQRERILRTLARARLGDSPVFETLDELPVHLIPQRAQIVLVSPLLTADVKPLIGLRARGRALLVISPDPVTFEERLLGEGEVVRVGARMAGLERALLLRRLQEAGITAVSWQLTTPFFQLAQTALRRLPPAIGRGLP